MKTMKCKSCGANLKFNESEKYATCPYCNSKYKVNDDVNFNINLDDNTKETIKHGLNIFGKTSIVISIFGIIVFITIILLAFNIFKNRENNSNKLNTNINNNSSIIDKTIFNSLYELNSGTQNKFFIETILNNVSNNNKKNKNMQIMVIYNEISTIDSDEIINIKHMLKDNKKYEIKLDYNDDGYVDKITILDL